jgi:hypothetical protein
MVDELLVILGFFLLLKNSKTFLPLGRNWQLFSKKKFPQEFGGDPVTAEIVDDEGKKVPVEVVDHNDGTYDATFTVHKEGTCCLKVRPRISALTTLPCLSDQGKLT